MKSFKSIAVAALLATPALSLAQTSHELSLANTDVAPASQHSLKGTNVVLVHGAFADGSSWSRVMALLEARGLHVIAVQNPLSSLEDDDPKPSIFRFDMSATNIPPQHLDAVLLSTKDDKMRLTCRVATYLDESTPSPWHESNTRNTINKGNIVMDTAYLSTSEHRWFLSYTHPRATDKTQYARIAFLSNVASNVSSLSKYNDKNKKDVYDMMLESSTSLMSKLKLRAKGAPAGQAEILMPKQRIRGSFENDRRQERLRPATESKGRHRPQTHLFWIAAAAYAVNASEPRCEWVGMYVARFQHLDLRRGLQKPPAVTA